MFIHSESKCFTKFQPVQVAQIRKAKFICQNVRYEIQNKHPGTQGTANDSRSSPTNTQPITLCSFGHVTQMQEVCKILLALL